MPELPDLELYLSALRRSIGGRRLDAAHVRSPFLVRSVDPEFATCIGRHVVACTRLGKRIVWEMEGELFLVFHLMIAGRFHWKRQPYLPRGKHDLAAFQFGEQTLLLTEVSTKKRAALHLVSGRPHLRDHTPPGHEPLAIDLDLFRQLVQRENHTLKRFLTSPALLAGIGNAYSDEILHAARLSPVHWTRRLNEPQIAELFAAMQTSLRDWTVRLQQELGDRFPEKVTAFRPGMAVHGRCGQPCPVCQTAIQRIRYAERETNYCPRCQTAGKLLADRSLSRLLRDDWPRTIEEAENG